MKRLLLDLYDRKLISRSSLQLKMDLDPEIETSNRATEGKTIDLFDEKLVKPIVDMVMAGILSVERPCQKTLGLPMRVFLVSKNWLHRISGGDDRTAPLRNQRDYAKYKNCRNHHHA